MYVTVGVFGMGFVLLMNSTFCRLENRLPIFERFWRISFNMFTKWKMVRLYFEDGEKGLRFSYPFLPIENHIVLYLAIKDASFKSSILKRMIISNLYHTDLFFVKTRKNDYILH